MNYNTLTRLLRKPKSAYRQAALNRIAYKNWGDLIQQFKAERIKELMKRSHRKNYLKNATKLKANQRAILGLKRKAPIHSDLKAILAIAKPNIVTGKLAVKTYVNKIGYEFCVIEGRTYLVHRLVVMEVTQDWIPTYLEVNHINGNKLDQRSENLELVTHRENILHALRTGLKKLKTPEEKAETKRKYRVRQRASQKAWVSRNIDKVRANNRRAYQMKKLRKLKAEIDAIGNRMKEDSK